MSIDINEFVAEHRALIAVAEACWRKDAPSYSWHVLSWMAYKQRCKYPLMRVKDRIINTDFTVP